MNNNITAPIYDRIRELKENYPLENYFVDIIIDRLFVNGDDSYGIFVDEIIRESVEKMSADEIEAFKSRYNIGTHIRDEYTNVVCNLEPWMLFFIMELRIECELEGNIHYSEHDIEYLRRRISYIDMFGTLESLNAIEYHDVLQAIFHTVYDYSHPGL